jgi:hypothetical protein
MEKHKCMVKGCISFGKYCRLHPSGTLKEPRPIAPRSKKLAKVMKKEYVPQVKEMVEKNTPCKVKSPVCTGKATGFHHLVGRLGKELTGKRKVPCCHRCNSWIEANDLLSRQMGWKDSKFSVPSKNQTILYAKKKSK